MTAIDRRERGRFDLLMTSHCDRNVAQYDRNRFMCLIDGECAPRTWASNK